MTKHYTTSQVAKLFMVQPRTVLRSHWKNKEYMGIVPVKLKNGKLAWPKDAVDKVCNTEDG